MARDRQDARRENPACRDERPSFEPRLIHADLVSRSCLLPHFDLLLLEP